MIAITDPEDPRIEPYRQIRDRDIKGRGGRFVAEGEVVLRVLLSGRSRFRAESVLLSEARAAVLGPIVAQLTPDLPVYVAAPPVMDAIAGFPIHRGVLALACRGSHEDAATLLTESTGPALALGLVGIANHDNVGGAFRNAAAFGCSPILLDRTCCDPLYRKAVRVSVGAALTVPFARGGSGFDLVEALKSAGFAVFALSPSGVAELASIRWPARAAILVGAEGPGLPPALLSALPSIRIDMAAEHDSLNVATATGVALHSIRSAQGWPK